MFADYERDTGFVYDVELIDKKDVLGQKAKVTSTPEPYDKGYPSWIITDVRFPNEVDRIKDLGGIIIKVRRNENNKDQHESNTALNGYNKFDYTIDNRKMPLEELVEVIKKIIH